MSDNVAPGPIGESFSVMMAKLFVLFLVLLGIAAVLHSATHGWLP